MGLVHTHTPSVQAPEQHPAPHCAPPGEQQYGELTAPKYVEQTSPLQQSAVAEQGPSGPWQVPQPPSTQLALRQS